MEITKAGKTLVFNETTPEEQKRLMAAAKDPASQTLKMLTRKQVASMLGCHIETIKRYSRNGLLRPVKFTARAVRYSEQEILDFMGKGVA
jgi:predicted DNA-binding transcriptional regulator AlpA